MQTAEGYYGQLICADPVAVQLTAASLRTDTCSRR